ncbi:MAG: adenosylcobinamide-GDP ribazoletransferase [Acetobacteraceae bacterium]|nr:adenosylcobinamide-GDP ribazoletransferase [Acetobacteraceae bacterium]
MRRDLLAALCLLTRLPVRVHAAPRPQGVWAYPLVGWAVGGLAALVFAALRAASVPASLASLWALAGTMLSTGALHEDGLADAADGLGGGADRARKLAIMRDSRIGSFGALALALSVLARATALAEIDRPGALVVVAVLGRAAMVLPLALLPPARADGMAAGLAAPPPAACALAFAVAVATAFAWCPPGQAAVALAAASLGALAVTALARRQLGGQTGDVLGAAEQVAECAAFTVLASL